MAYIPKSKVNILDTPGNELISKLTGIPYIGKYIELSNGKYYAGSNPNDLGDELIFPKTSKLINNKTTNNLTYSNLKPKVPNFLSSLKTIYPTKISPTEEDYERGYYTRYFTKKVNEPKGYMEVDIDVFNSISQQKNEYDFYLYEVGSLIWNLKNGTSESNFTNLQILERIFPFVSLLFPKLNEFEIVDQVINNLNTEGGELYYANGEEYIGPYHIHPEKGPMVGAQHITQPHENLYYFEDIPDPQSLPEQQSDVPIGTRVDIPVQTNRTPIPTTTYIGGGSSMGKSGY